MAGTKDYVLQGLPEGPAKWWYLEHMSYVDFEGHYNDMTQKGYQFDPKSGLFFRQVLPNEVIKEIGRTVLDIAFLRPTDLHYHADVKENLTVLKGLGLAHISGEEVSLREGTTIIIPRGVRHTLRPDKDTTLEMRLACTGILNSKKEFTITPFNKYKPWIDYFS